MSPPDDPTLADRPPARARDRVVIVNVADGATAHERAAQGSAVLVVGTDAEATGALVRALLDAGHRSAAFVGDATSDSQAVAEMIAELFPDLDPDAPEPA